MVHSFVDLEAGVKCRLLQSLFDTYPEIDTFIIVNKDHNTGAIDVTAMSRTSINDGVKAFLKAQFGKEMYDENSEETAYWKEVTCWKDGFRPSVMHWLDSNKKTMDEVEELLKKHIFLKAGDVPTFMADGTLHKCNTDCLRVYHFEPILAAQRRGVPSLKVMSLTQLPTNDLTVLNDLELDVARKMNTTPSAGPSL